MPDPADLLSDEPGLPDEQVMSATILDDAAAPTDLVRCTLADDPGHATDPMPWSPVARPDGLYYPKKGDEGLVALPALGHEVLTWFSPSATEPDHAF